MFMFFKTNVVLQSLRSSHILEVYNSKIGASEGIGGGGAYDDWLGWCIDGMIVNRVFFKN